MRGKNAFKNVDVIYSRSQKNVHTTEHCSEIQNIKEEEVMKLIMERCPTDMCHASTLLKTGPDRFLVAWFGGTKEGNGDVAIWITRGNEEYFDAPQILAQSDEAHWNPVLFRINESKIILFYKVGNEISKWRTMYRISEDNGETFGGSFCQ